jgi:hypothetical protein
MLNHDASVTAEICGPNEIHAGTIRICFCWFATDDKPCAIRLYHRKLESPSFARLASLAFDAWYYNDDVQPLLLGLGWRFQHSHADS